MQNELLVLFFTLGVILAGGAILFANFIMPHSYNQAKFEAYECGIPSEQNAWRQFNVGYYMFALIYLIFDVEIVFIYPWGEVIKEVGMSALVEILIFFFVLALGLAYAWKKKALQWE